MVSDAQKRANEKWRLANLAYFQERKRNKYANDPSYRERCKNYVRRSRNLHKEINQLMMIQV